VEAGTGWSG